MGGNRANNLTRRGAIAAASATAALGFARPLFAAGEPRVALLVGNRAYAPEVGTLVNPIRDVALVSKTLIDAGFAADDIVVATNATRKTFEKALDDYHAKLVKAGSNAIGVVYYCGHGATNVKDGKSYLVPIDAPTARGSALWQASVTTDDVFTKLGRFPGLQLVLLDCCRTELAFDDPRPASTTVASTSPQVRAQGLTKGFVAVRSNRPQNMFISYAAWEGELASDGEKGATNGPYAKAFAESVRGAPAGAAVVDIFDQVRLRVLATTRETQEPMNLSRTNAVGAGMKPFTGGSGGGITPVSRAKPRALVIGNTYAANEKLHLRHASDDADAVHNALQKCGFDADRERAVLNKAAFFKKLTAFADALKDTIGVLYFAGYGCGVVGRNFLLPDGVSVKTDEDMERDGIAVMDVVNVFLKSRARAAFIALDCARKIGLAFKARSLEAGLMNMDTSKNVVVSYSAFAGDYMVDQRGPSVYAAALADRIQRPERRSLQQIADAVETDVFAKTGKKQRPWFQETADVPIYFRVEDGLIPKG